MGTKRRTKPLPKKKTPKQGTALHPSFDTPAERVEYCFQLIAAVPPKWDRGKTDKELAFAWGLSVDTVQGYSATARQNLDIVTKERRSSAANIGLDTLETIAIKGARSSIPGDKGAARSAAKDLLEFAGVDKPDENQPRAPTVTVLIGQVATSPAMKMLVGVGMGTDGASSNANQGETPHQLPTADRNGPLV